MEVDNFMSNGLLAWYPFSSEAKILILNSRNNSTNYFLGCGNNINIESSDLDTFINSYSRYATNLYDYIIGILAIENVDNPVDLLLKTRKCLKPTGKLILVTDNKLGLRYFCGEKTLNYNGFFGNLNALSSFSESNNTKKNFLKAEIKDFLCSCGFNNINCYSILPNLYKPQLIFNENYTPTEKMENRYIPYYEDSDNIFLDEAKIYDALIKNNVFHEFANNYLFECSNFPLESNIFQITLSLDRKPENAMITVIEESKVKKISVSNNLEHICNLYENTLYLKKKSVPMVDCKIIDGVYEMPFIKGEIANTYLQCLFDNNIDDFFIKFDEYCELIKKSSETYESDNLGIVLKKGFIDLVPINCFYINNQFVFFDQEYCYENLPLNVLIFRALILIYADDIIRQKKYPIEKLYKKYGIDLHLEEYKEIESSFLKSLRQEHSVCYDKHHISSVRLLENQFFIKQGRAYKNKNDILWQYLGNLKKESCFINLNDKNIVVWGTGNFAKKFLCFYKDELNIKYCIDSDVNKQGGTFLGFEIKSPDYLENLDTSSTKIIICMKYYKEVYASLLSIGFYDIGIYDANFIYPGRQVLVPELEKQTKNLDEKKKYNIGYIAGVFDLYHIGHLNMFKRAKEQCEYLIVGVSSDKYVTDIKKRIPFIPFEERIEMIRSCKYVDEVHEIPFEYRGTVEAFQKYHFDVQFSGSDYINDFWWLEQQKYLRQHGSELIFFPYTEQTSSTKIKSLIEKGLL